PAARDDEVAALDRIRLRRRLMWLLFFTTLPGVYVVDHLLAFLLPTATGTLTFEAAGYIWMLAWGTSLVLVAFSRWPRCGGYFHVSRSFFSWNHWWTPRCMHCDLSLTRRRQPPVE